MDKRQFLTAAAAMAATPAFGQAQLKKPGSNVLPLIPNHLLYAWDVLEEPHHELITARNHVQYSAP